MTIAPTHRGASSLAAPRRLVLASGNPGKVREFGHLLQPLGFEVVSQSALGVPDAPEPFPTFLENALGKARNAAAHTGLAALADDSGICVPALGGAPGVHSARYAGEDRDDRANNRKLVEAMRGVAERSAYYYCVLVLIRTPDDPQPLIADGIWFGEIVDEPRGDGGFGYDPYFFVPGLGKCAAELDAIQKNAISHRARALRSLHAALLGLRG